MNPTTSTAAWLDILHRSRYPDHPVGCSCSMAHLDEGEAEELERLAAEAGWSLRPIVSLPSEASTRSGGPSTSRSAASSIEDLNGRQAAVLEVARWLVDGWTLDRLVSTYALSAYLPPQTEQSVRSRAAELKRAGHLEVIGTGTSAHGRPARTWRVTRVGEARAA